MKVSVSVTTYNHAPYIAQALDGILMQETDFDFEVIVGDDCSNDGTREIVQDYERRFPDRIRSVLPEHNLGDGGRPMFVETIKRCKGEYVAMLDGDDYWTAPDKLRQQVEYLEAHRECSLCYHNAQIIHEDGTEPAKHFLPPDHPPFAGTEELLWSCFIPACSAMIRREVIGEFPAWYFATPWADRPLYLLASERGKLGYLDQVMGVYRVHATGLWSSLDPIDQIEGARRFLFGLDVGLRTRYQRTISQILGWQSYELARVHAERGSALRATQALCAAMRHDPRASCTGYTGLLRVAIHAYKTAGARGWQSA